MNRVSVFIPSYNYARFLPSAVASVLDQTGVDVEVLIIDDASTDETPEVAAELARDARVSHVRHATNRGHLETYNEGLEWADADYTVLLSADDMLTPGALARACALMDTHPDVTFVYGGVQRFHTNCRLPSPRIDGDPAHWRLRPGIEWIESVCRTGRNFVVAPEVVVRTAAQTVAGGYRSDLPHSADMELWLRLAALGTVGWLPRADQAYYRLHETNMSGTRFGQQLQRLTHRWAAFDAFFSTEGSRLPEAAPLRDMAARAVARSALVQAREALDEGADDEQTCGQVEGLVAFACSLTDPHGLPEMRAVQWRRRLGPRTRRHLAPVVAAVSLRRPRAWLRWHLRDRPR